MARLGSVPPYLNLQTDTPVDGQLEISFISCFLLFHSNQQHKQTAASRNLLEKVEAQTFDSYVIVARNAEADIQNTLQ